MATVAVHYVLVALSLGFAVILTLKDFILLPSLFFRDCKWSAPGVLPFILPP